MKYCRVQSNIYDVRGIIADPSLEAGINFFAGNPITQTLPSPLEFQTNYLAGEEPKHWLGSAIPILSDALIAGLRHIGIDNFQTFPVLLHNQENGMQWSNCQAFNLIGLFDAADMDASQYDVLIPGNNRIPPVLGFNTLVISSAKAGDAKMFRLPQDPTLIIMAEDKVDQLCAAAPVGGWGISIFDLE